MADQQDGKTQPLLSLPLSVEEEETHLLLLNVATVNMCFIM